jgi:hypothetical protein
VSPARYAGRSVEALIVSWEAVHLEAVLDAEGAPVALAEFAELIVTVDSTAGAAAFADGLAAAWPQPVSATARTAATPVTPLDHARIQPV